MLIIGIDPSIQDKNCGFAVWSTIAKELLVIEGINTYMAIKKLESYAKTRKEGEQIGVIVEDAGLDKVVFRQGHTRAALIKIAINAGQNGGAARTLIQACECLGLKCLKIAPSARKRADKSRLPLKLLTMPTKTKTKAFRELTGWGERTNEHGRDAATLVFGMSRKNFETRYKLQN